MTLRMAEPHILFTVVAGVLKGMPAPKAAWRAGACPSPADRTHPMMTSSMSPAGILESASAALRAAAPSCGPVRPASAPRKAPTGVRRADRMTTGSELIAIPQIDAIRLKYSPRAGNQRARTLPIPQRRNSRREGLAHRFGDQLPAAFTGVLGIEHFEDLEAQRTAVDHDAAGRKHLAAAVNRRRHHRHIRPLSGRERAAEEAADLALRIEGALRKKHERLAAGSELPDAAGVRAALVTVEAFHECRSEPPQQQARQRHTHHFFLDHEGKGRRERRGGHDTVDVARMIGDP